MHFFSIDYVVLLFEGIFAMPTKTWVKVNKSTRNEYKTIIKTAKKIIQPKVGMDILPKPTPHFC